MLGLLVGLVTTGSWIAASIFQFHDDSEVTREVFGNIPTALKAAFYTVTSLLIVYGAVLFAQRVQT